jgi:hypothetical protein
LCISNTVEQIASKSVPLKVGAWVCIWITFFPQVMNGPNKLECLSLVSFSSLVLFLSEAETTQVEGLLVATL